VIWAGFHVAEIASLDPECVSNASILRCAALEPKGISLRRGYSYTLKFRQVILVFLGIQASHETEKVLLSDCRTMLAKSLPNQLTIALDFISPFKRVQMRSDLQFRDVHLLAVLAIWQVVVCSAACPQEITQRRRVAILNFEDYSSENTGASGVVGVRAGDVGKGISAQLIEKLASGGKYTVIDQSAVRQVLGEQTSSELDSMDANGRATRIGRILGLDAMIVGAITRLGPDAVQKTSHSRMSKRKSKAYADITARVLDMTTGEVITEFTATGESARSGEVLVIGAHEQSKATTEILGSEFADSLLGEATRNAVEKIAVQLNSFAEKIPPLRLEIEGLVAEVAGNLVTLNLGKKYGVRVGDKFAVLRGVSVVPDHQTAGSVPSVVEQVSEATVTEVDELYATATSSGPGQVRVGDRVKRIADSQTAPH
jgi:curli biogenesis system outer membrane secretion channel CsgG